jgi:2,4-dienoyl-CoA reductase-like NADH-dependent reductase (Old Yellow Enzyme family)
MQARRRPVPPRSPKSNYRIGQMLDAGHADLVAFGRPFVSNPDLPAAKRALDRFTVGKALSPNQIPAQGVKIARRNT